MKSKGCHHCKHFYVYADAGYYYSEYTWHSGYGIVKCEKGKYYLNIYDHDIETGSVVKALSKGDNCKEFEERK